MRSCSASFTSWIVVHCDCGGSAGAGCGAVLWVLLEGAIVKVLVGERFRIFGLGKKEKENVRGEEIWQVRGRRWKDLKGEYGLISSILTSLAATYSWR